MMDFSVSVSSKDITLQITLLFKFTNVKLSPKKGVHIYWLTANLQLNEVATSLNTVSDKSNLHMRTSLNLQTTN